MKSKRRLKCKVVIFDWNGTLLNDLEISYKSTVEIFRRFNLPPPPLHEYRSHILPDPLGFYRLRGLPQNIKEEELDEIRRESLKNNWGDVTLQPGSLEAIAACKNRDLSAGLISGELGDILESRLTQFELTKAFTYTQGDVEDKERALLDFLEWSGENGFKRIEPERIIFVTDMVHDIYAAQRVGVTTVGLTAGYSEPKKIRAARPNFIINSLELLPKILSSAT